MVISKDPLGIFEKESRKPIKLSVKKEVYARAKGYCECCAIKLTMSQGDFHHWRSPTVSPTAKTVQFLCPTCHRKYGHTKKVVTSSGILGEKKVKIIRHKVRRRKKIPLKKKPTKKKTSTRKKRTTKKKPTKRKKRATKRKTRRKKK